MQELLQSSTWVFDVLICMFGSSVSREEHTRVAGQVASGIGDVPRDRVQEHGQAVKDIHIPLIPEQWRERGLRSGVCEVES